MRISKTGLTSMAAVALFASPVVAQNAAVAVDNTIGEVGNAADAVGNSISTGASSIANAADNAVDVDVTTDPGLANTTSSSTAPPTDNMAMDNMAMDDANMMATDPMMENTTTTTTSMQQQQSGGGGRWGLLGLLGLASFLFRPKKAAIRLDERNGR